MADQLRHKIKDLTGIGLYESDYFINILKAKVALDDNDLKTALIALLENQLQTVTKSHGVDMNKVNTVLNRPVCLDGPTIKHHLKFNN